MFIRLKVMQQPSSSGQLIMSVLSPCRIISSGELYSCFRAYTTSKDSYWYAKVVLYYVVADAMLQEEQFCKQKDLQKRINPYTGIWQCRNIRQPESFRQICSCKCNFHSFSFYRQAFKGWDKIRVIRPCTPEWLAELGTDRLGNQQEYNFSKWQPGQYTMAWERNVTQVSKEGIEIDVPITMSLILNMEEDMSLPWNGPDVYII